MINDGFFDVFFLISFFFQIYRIEINKMLHDEENIKTNVNIIDNQKKHYHQPIIKRKTQNSPFYSFIKINSSQTNIEIRKNHIRLKNLESFSFPLTQNFEFSKVFCSETTDQAFIKQVASFIVDQNGKKVVQIYGSYFFFKEFYNQFQKMKFTIYSYKFDYGVLNKVIEQINESDSSIGNKSGFIQNSIEDEDDPKLLLLNDPSNKQMIILIFVGNDASILSMLKKEHQTFFLKNYKLFIITIIQNNDNNIIHSILASTSLISKNNIIPSIITDTSQFCPKPIETKNSNLGTVISSQDHENQKQTDDSKIEINEIINTLKMLLNRSNMVSESLDLQILELENELNYLKQEEERESELIAEYQNKLAEYQEELLNVNKKHDKIIADKEKMQSFVVDSISLNSKIKEQIHYANERSNATKEKIEEIIQNDLINKESEINDILLSHEMCTRIDILHLEIENYLKNSDCPDTKI